MIRRNTVLTAFDRVISSIFKHTDRIGNKETDVADNTDRSHTLAFTIFRTLNNKPIRTLNIAC